MKLPGMLAVCFWVVGLGSQRVVAGEATQVFWQHLEEAGERLCCHFAVESVGSAGSLNNPILDSMVDVDYSGAKTVDAMVAALRETRLVWTGGSRPTAIRLVVESVKVNNRSVIMVRDARIPDLPGYPLARKVSLSYEGTPEGLVQHLAGHDQLIQRQAVYSIGVPLFIDGATPIRVDAKDRRVRDVLTECIPLQGYRRVVWSSYTDGKAASPVVTVRFYGRVPK